MDALLIWILIGSWLAPIGTLLISWYVTRNYLRDLKNEAVEAAKKTEIAAKNIEKRIISSMQTNFNDDLVEKIREIIVEQMADAAPNFDVSEISQQIVTDLSSEILTDLQDSIKKTVRSSSKALIRELKEDINKDSSSGLGLLTSLLGMR